MRVQRNYFKNDRPVYTLKLDAQDVETYLAAQPDEFLRAMYPNPYSELEFRLIKREQPGLSDFSRLVLRGWKAELGADEKSLRDIVEQSQRSPKEMNFIGRATVGYVRLALTSSREE